MKLELKHIAPYLPYQLKVIEVCNGKQVNDEFIVDCVNWNGGNIGGSDASLDSFELERAFNLRDIKPILRPMSDLYREINGSVGIVELAKIAGYKDEEIKSYVLDGQTNYTIPYTFHVDGRVFKRRGEFFFSPKAKSFLFDYFDNGDESKSNFLGDETNYQFGVDNQLELFSYLFEHHFDVFGLIDKGLAIDKTELK